VEKSSYRLKKNKELQDQRLGIIKNDTDLVAILWFGNLWAMLKVEYHAIAVAGLHVLLIHMVFRK
jgi:uncharacterized integral membrane protein